MRTETLRSIAASSLLALCVATVSSPARADGVLPAAATPVQREQAQARFLKGKDLFSRKKFDEALTEFRASIDIVASPNTRLQIARTLRAMAKYVASYAELGRAMAEAKELSAGDSRYKLAYDAAVQERTELQPLLGFVTLTLQNAADGTRVMVGDEEILRAAWSEPVPVYGGSAEIDVLTPGHAPVKNTVTVAAGATAALTVDATSGAPDQAVAEAPPPPPPPAPPPPPPPPSFDNRRLRPWAYVSGGVGAAGLITFGIFGAMASSSYNDLNSACTNGACPSSKSGEISSGKTDQTVANVGLVVGIVGAAAGGVLFVLSMPKKTDAAPAATLVVGPSWVGLKQAF